MNLLPSSTVRLITSSQVITSVSSVVKELIENALDAGASSIEVKLDGWGLERIEVRDNGCGIKPEDAPFMGQAHYTSKISSDNDLKFLQTYGFRGEALGSLSSVSNVSVLTKTVSEEVGMLYTLERNGKIGATQPKPTTTGTTIIATNLFKNLPVRKQFSSNSKKCKEELKRVEDLVMAYALIHPTLRIILRHNKAVVWQKSKVSDQRTALSSVFGTSLLARMGVIEFHDENGSGIHVLGYVPRPGYDLEITGRAVNDRCFVFVNGRPVQMKQVSQLIKQYYNRQSTVSSNRCPVAFLSVNVPPELLDVNLEPNKTSVMLTNKDELMKILTDLLEEFYSDEKNKLPSSKGDDCNSSTEKRIALIGKLEDITNTWDLNREVTTQRALSNAGEKSKEKERYYLHLGTDMVLEDCPSLVQPEVEGTHNKQAKAISSSSLPDNSSAQDKTLSYNNDMQSEKASCHEGRSPADEVKDKVPSSVIVQPVSLPSSLQDDTGTLSPIDSLQLCETLSDKTLCEASESTCNLNNKCKSSKVSRGATENDSLELFETISDRTSCKASESTCDLDNGCNPSEQSSSAKENGHLDTANNLNVSNLNSDKSNKQNEMQVVEVLNTENGSNVTSTEGRPERSQETSSKNKALACTPSNSPSLQNLFSLDLDDVFEDSDLDLFGTTGTSDNVCSSDKDASEGRPSNSSATVEESVSAPKSSKTSKFLCSDKDWSIGCGIVDKQGNPVQPVTLVTPGPLRQISVNRTTVTPLHGKRKHSSDKERSRLSLSSKKIKKSPEITNQPLINQVMSPNPLQRKLLYKKKEIPFSLSDLKESVKRKKDLRSEENSEHLIGRLDPWGVWLLRRGTDLVCVNQYRIQEQLLFQRLMACHSLPKEGLNHPITLNERIVGGPDCWRTLCNMSSKCDPPDTTRWIDDERLTSNGFHICFKTDADSGDTKVELYKMSTSIPFYGVPDLAEVLELVCHKDKRDSNSLSSCRPFKVVHYLQGEAVRVARALSSRMNRTEVDELLSRMEEQITEETRACVHGRPFFEKIAEIPQE